MILLHYYFFIVNSFCVLSAIPLAGLYMPIIFCLQVNNQLGNELSSDHLLIKATAKLNMHFSIIKISCHTGIT